MGTPMSLSLPRARQLARFFYVQRIKGFTVSSSLYFGGGGAEDAFREQMANCRSYLEYGSGSSTLYAARAGIPTVAVESDHFFARAVLREIEGDAPVRFALPDIGLTIELGQPAFKRPTPRRVRRWARYVDAPYALLDSLPDFILIDGRFRAACLLEAARRAHESGQSALVMFDDYGNRPRYHHVEAHVGAPHMIGRAAFFEIGPGHGATIRRETVEAAVADWS